MNSAVEKFKSFSISMNNLQRELEKSQQCLSTLDEKLLATEQERDTLRLALKLIDDERSKSTILQHQDQDPHNQIQLLYSQCQPRSDAPSQMIGPPIRSDDPL